MKSGCFIETCVRYRSRQSLTRRNRQGNYATIFMLSLLPMLGFASLVVDIGYQHVARAQLSASLDAAAFAGAGHLDGTEAGLTAAREAAQLVGALNPAAGHAVTLDANESNAETGDIVFGVWDESSGSFAVSNDPASINAITVRDRVSWEGMLSPIAVRHSTLGVNAESTVLEPSAEGAGEVTCYLPLAIADCMLDQYTESELQNLTLKLNPAGIDNVGWARIGASPNASWLSGQISDCESDGPAQVGDLVGLNNGVINSALSALDSAVEGSTTTWNTSDWGTIPTQHARSSIAAAKYGHTYEGAIVVFDGGPGYCTGSGGSFNQFEVITGFIWGAVYDVRTGSAAQKNIQVRLDLNSDRAIGTRGGGLDAGVLYQPPVTMVR